jgi:hypothetical protein
VKYIIPTRDWVEFLKARLNDVVEDGYIPKDELRYSNSVCNHVVKQLLIMRLRDYVLWIEPEKELNLVPKGDLLTGFKLEVLESVIARIFPNFSESMDTSKNAPATSVSWGDIIEMEVIQPLDDYIQDHLTTTLTLEPTWKYATLKQLGTSYILDLGEDYRVLFWEKYRTLVNV